MFKKYFCFRFTVFCDNSGHMIEIETFPKSSVVRVRTRAVSYYLISSKKTVINILYKLK